MSVPAAAVRPEIRPGSRVEVPLGDGLSLRGEVQTLVNASDGIVLTLIDDTGHRHRLKVLPDTALGLCIVTPPVSLSDAISLAGQIVGGAQPRIPVTLQLSMLAGAVLSLASRRAP
ncbi:MAG TPA: hypothetical protein VD995_03210 [Azospirillum sp.]|nr:hypothetical protein [Azospirillum sp.]